MFSSFQGSLKYSLSVSGGILLGGECCWSGGSCYTTDNSVWTLYLEMRDITATKITRIIPGLIQKGTNFAVT